MDRQEKISRISKIVTVALVAITAAAGLIFATTKAATMKMEKQIRADVAEYLGEVGFDTETIETTKVLAGGATDLLTGDSVNTERFSELVREEVVKTFATLSPEQEEALSDAIETICLADTYSYISQQDYASRESVDALKKQLDVKIDKLGDNVTTSNNKLNKSVAELEAQLAVLKKTSQSGAQLAALSQQIDTLKAEVSKLDSTTDDTATKSSVSSIEQKLKDTTAQVVALQGDQSDAVKTLKASISEIEDAQAVDSKALSNALEETNTSLLKKIADNAADAEKTISDLKVLEGEVATNKTSLDNTIAITTAIDKKYTTIENTVINNANKTETIINEIQADLAGQADELQGYIDEANDAYSGHLDALRAAEAAARNTITTTTNAGVESIGENKDSALSAVSGAENSALDNIGNDKDSALSEIGDAKDDALGSIATDKSSSLSSISSAKDGALGNIATDRATSLSDIGDARTGALSDIDDARSGIASDKAGALGSIASDKAGALEEIASAKSGAEASIGSGGTDALSSISSAKSDALQAISDDLGEVGGSGARGAIDSDRASALAQIAAALGSAPSAGPSSGSGALGDIASALKDATDAISGAQGTATGAIAAAQESAVSDVESTASEATTSLNNIKSDVNGMKSDVNTMKSNVEGIADDIDTKKADIDTKYQEIRNMDKLTMTISEEGGVTKVTFGVAPVTNSTVTAP